MPPESTLSPPIKSFLTNLGYAVKGEINGCDLLAIHPESQILVITELKTTLSLELILQAVDRLTAADEVWIAVPATTKGRDRDPRARALCRLLGIGLLTVNLKTNHVEPICHPAAYTPRRNKKWRSRLITEFHRRRGDPMDGGVNNRKIMTAYRQTCLALATALAQAPARPRDLKHLAEKPGPILARNIYGWFTRLSPGLYGLTPLGEQEASKQSLF